TWEALPDTDVVGVDTAHLVVRGKRPTGGTPERLTVRVDDQRATAQITVVPTPMRLEVTPAGPVELPAGLSQRFQVWADHGNGRRVEVPAEEVTWEEARGEGLEQRGAEVVARAPGGTLRVQASYRGQK